MKQLLIIINLIILCIAFFAYIKSQKNYEAACFYADVAHSLINNDNIATYNNWVQEFDSLEFDYLTEEDIEDYSWCY